MAAPQPGYKSLDYEQLEQALASPKADKPLFEQVVNAPFEFKAETAFLFLGIIVLLLQDKKHATINRIALSNTELATRTTDVSAVPFKDIKIPADHVENIIAQAIRAGEPRDTTDWKFLFTPALLPEQARINQASAGIAYSAVYPFGAREGGALIYSYFQYEHEIGEAQRDFMRRYTDIVNSRLQAR